MKALEVKNNIYWVGALDKKLKVFDIIMTTPYGTTYNSYVVKGKNKTAVFETVKEKFFDEYVERLKSLNIDISKIDYIVVNHTEPDHAGAIGKMLDLAPKAKVVGSPAAIKFIKAIANKEFETIVVKDGDKLDLGGKTIKFINAPFLHWPDSIYSYVEEDKVLITCDSFGSHYCLDKVFNDYIENEEEYMEALKYYFDMIIGPFKSYVLKAVDKIKDLDIDVICPGHGPILRDNPLKIVEIYKKWSTEELPQYGKKRVVISYVSAYGYTEAMAEKIAEAIKSKEDFIVDLFDITKHNVEEILNKIYLADGILFGSPTINGDALKPVMDILNMLNPIVHGKKVAGAFGSYGWSGEAVRNIESRLKSLKMDIVPGIRANFRPSEEELNKSYEFGETIAEKIIEKSNPKSVNEQSSSMKLWKCVVCGQVFPGLTPPEVCPACGASKEQFVELEKDDLGFKSDKDEKFVIIGNGIAGYTAAESIRKRNKVCSIEILSSEKVLTYYRPQLSDYLQNKLPDSEFYVSDENWYKDNNILVKLGVNVSEIKSENKKVVLENGEEVKYDKLIIANGARSFLPPVKGSDKEGVVTLRSLEDAERIMDKMENAKVAVVVGGGLLGLEGAWAMRQRGLEVYVIERSNRLLVRQLDEEGAKIFKKIVDDSGVHVLTEEDTEEILGEDKVSGFKLKSGKIIDSDIVLFSTGVRPRKEVAEKSGLKVDKGVIVNEKMETNIKDIYACGDVAELNGRAYGNWPAAIEMAKVAGANASGDDIVFEGFVPSTVFTSMNANVFSCGDVASSDLVGIGSTNLDKNIYKKMFFRKGVIVGGILIGDTKSSVKIMEGIQEEKSVKAMLSDNILLY
jgi:flavorubredoxin/NADPH-dependent 2,4-dienoyl-CoA reductase/sulfur reductase-like enzyme